MSETEFEAWFAELQILMKATDAYGSMRQANWIGYFEDGYSPRDALNEDQSYDRGPIP